MRQKVLFKDEKKKIKDNQVDLGSGLTLESIGGPGKQVTKIILYRQGVRGRTIDSSDRVAKRLFVLEALEMGAKSRI